MPTRVSIEERDAGSSDEESFTREAPVVDERGENDSDGTPDRGDQGAKKGWGKVKEMMPSNDVDEMGREKVRVNVGGIRRTVNTEEMDEVQFKKFR